MAEQLALNTDFMVANLLSWTEFTNISYSKVAMDSLSGYSPIIDNYSFLGTFYKDLPSWNLKKEVRYVPKQKVETYRLKENP